MVKLAEQLSQDLLSNLRSLADQLIRKPESFTPHWAKSIGDSFRLYTRTNTINIFLALNGMLHDEGWPFPAYLDLEQEIRSTRFSHGKLSLLLGVLLGSLSLSDSLVNFSIVKPEAKSKFYIDWYLSRRFRKAAKDIFISWQAHPLLKKKDKILSDVYLSYKKQLWGVCIPSMLPLLDFLMRDYFHSNDLRDSVGTLVEAFKLSGITSNGLKPGYGIWDSLKKGSDEVRVTDKVERDLRLPGIYLSSFIDFAARYYSWHTTTSDPGELNRHAVVHGDMNYCSEVDTTKFLMFFDLTLKLEPVLRIVIGTVQKYSDLS